MEDAASPLTVASLAFVGAGSAATVLARRCVDVGLPVVAVASRSMASAQRLADRVEAEATDLAGAMQSGADAVVFCVPDHALSEVARAAAAHSPRGGLAVHTSGSLSSGVLVSLRLAGMTPLAFHPAQALARDSDPATLIGAAAGLDGSAAAIASGRKLAERLGMVPVVIDPNRKAVYHAAMSVASNFAVTLAALAQELLREAGVEQPSVVIGPLLRGTLANLNDQPPARALTGPIVRGDAATVEQHLAVIAASAPHALPTYCALGAETVRLAHTSGRLSARKADVLLGLLHAAIAPPPAGDPERRAA